MRLDERNSAHGSIAPARNKEAVPYGGGVTLFVKRSKTKSFHLPFENYFLC